MNQVFVSVGGFKPRIVYTTENDTLSTIFGSSISGPETYVLHNGKLASLDTQLVSGDTYHIIPRVLGGKGGFGSMLRALGAQIEKTTNREACRDISGRRMRDVNNEQKLREWVAKASDREREKEQKRRDRWERRRAEPRHVFDDPEYTKQKMQVTEELEDALQQGLQKASTSATASATATTSSRKRKSEEAGPSNAKKAALEWLGVDNLSDLDTDSDCDSDDGGPSMDRADSRAGPSGSVIPDSGAVSGASSHTTECEEHSDSGVESVTEPKPHDDGSPMDVDSDSSAKDSAMNSDGEQLHNPNVAHLEVMQMDHHQTANSAKETSSSASLDTSAQSQHSLLQALETHKPKSEEAPTEPPKVVVESVDLLSYQSVTELEALGLDNLKAILMSKTMKCGGTLKQRAERLWAVRGLTKDQIDPSLLAKPPRGKKK